MCFSSGKSNTTPPAPNPQARFDYNVPQTGRTQQQAVAQANTPTVDPTGQGQLGAVPEMSGSY